jgi:hypothetical protein
LSPLRAELLLPEPQERDDTPAGAGAPTDPDRNTPSAPALAPVYSFDIEPASRVTWVVETAKAVIQGRLDASDGAAAVQAQQAQLVRLLRQDRDSVTRRESDAVATRLALLAEQVGDAASANPDNEAHHVIARVLSELARSLR